MENQAVGNRTKHIDIRWHHIRSMLDGDTPRMVIQFTRSENNFGDLATKNVTEAVHSKLAPMLRDGRIARAIILANTEREDVSNSRSIHSGMRNPVDRKFRSSHDDVMRRDHDTR